MESEKYLNIRDVSQKTGVAAVTLRAWERRYGLIRPKRTPKGHRLYSNDNIEQIMEIIEWLDRGVAISKIATLLNAEQKRLDNDSNATTNAWQKERQELLAALVKLKQRNLEILFDNLNQTMPFSSLCKKVYKPVAEQLIMRWQSRPLGYELEQQLWQQTWQRQTIQMTERVNKQNLRAYIWLIHLGEIGLSIEYWLNHTLLLASGFRVNAIFELNDLSLLPRLHESMQQPLIIVCNRRMKPEQIHQLVKAKSLWNDDLIVIGQSAHIHQDILSEQSIEHVGGDANTCWHSTAYQKWLEQVELEQ